MLKIVVAVLLALCLSAAVDAKQTDKCRALALSGGGDKGSYEVGVIQGLVNNLPANESQWNVITGISAGSMTAAAASKFPLGDEINMASFLVETSLNLTGKDIIQQWPGGLIEGLFSKPSLFDSSPLRRTMENLIGNMPSTDRKVVIGATNIVTGKLDYWNETDVINGVLASSAVPGVFTPQTYNGNTYVDGGIKYGIDPMSAITTCREMGYEDNDIIIDIIQCIGSTLPPTPAEPTKMTTLLHLLRQWQIQQYDTYMKIVEEVRLAFPHINWRYNIWPSTPIPGSGLDFNHTAAVKMVELGNADALNAIKHGAKATWSKWSASFGKELY